MRKSNISITICTIGMIATENVLTLLKELGLEVAAKFPQVGTPSDAAMAIIKGGAQRMSDVEFPRTLTFAFTNLYHFIPEMYCAIIRYIWS